MYLETIPVDKLTAQKEPEFGPLLFNPERFDAFLLYISGLTCSYVGENFSCVGVWSWDPGLHQMMSLELKFIFV